VDFWKSLSGMLTVQFTSAVPEKTLDILTRTKIPLSHVVQKNELTYELQIQRRDYKQLSGILQRRGDRLEIVKRSGMYWMLKSLFHRPVLLTTILILLILTFLLPARIFFITVEGNTTIPDRMILSAAEECGIRFGASRKLVRSEKMKNELLSAVPQLQWAGVNTSGCTAVISVRERREEQPRPEERHVRNIIADRDGYVLSTTITGGTPLVFPGDSVTRGQLLISGYTDCGLCIRASRAEGEIFAQTNRTIEAVMPEIFDFVERDSEVLYKFSLILGKKRINLWKDSRISDISCGRMYEEYFVSLPGGFQLPVAICVDRYVCYEIQKSAISQTDAQIQLRAFSDAYLLRQMVAGQILQKQYRFSYSDNLYKLESSCVCTEMIGREQREQIGVMNGKRN